MHAAQPENGHSPATRGPLPLWAPVPCTGTQRPRGDVKTWLWECNKPVLESVYPTTVRETL